MVKAIMHNVQKQVLLMLSDAKIAFYKAKIAYYDWRISLLWADLPNRGLPYGPGQLLSDMCLTTVQGDQPV